MPDVVLVAPPNTSMADPRIAPPLGILYLAAAQRRAGFSDPVVVDLNVACHEPGAPKDHPGGNTHDFSLGRCLREIPGGASVYGLSLASMQMPHGVALLAALREREPGAVLVVGGAHVSADVDDLVGLADVAIRYEGEDAWVALLRTVDRARSLGPNEALDYQAALERSEPRLRGRVSVRGGPSYDPEAADPRQVVNVRPTIVVDGLQVDPLDDAPVPARDLLDFSRYTRRIAGERATNIITSRGCPARCIYCQQEDLWGAGLRLQTPRRVLAEVDSIRETTGIGNLLFLDDSLTACSTARMHELCDGLRERGVKWRGWTRANLISRPGSVELLSYMRKSGFVSCCVGVEAGTDRLLRNIAKQTTVAQNRAALRNLRAAGVKVRCSIMVGLPGETWEDVRALVRFVAEEQPDDWILSSLVPLPGTPSWTEAERFGIRIDREGVRGRNYSDVFIVGGNEQSGQFHELDGVDADEIRLRHDYVQENLLRWCPRDRRGVIA